MRLYRFSPTTTEEGLLNAIKHIHFASHKLCKTSFGEYLNNAGNIGIFCHYDDEFLVLKKIQKTLVEPSDNPEQKYFTLIKPIVVPQFEDVPETIYTHLYIRRPDPYRHHVGDLDFFLPEKKYQILKQRLLDGKEIKDARVFERPDLDMIELYNPNIDVLAYVSTETMTQDVRVKLSEITKL